jgi:hypothetical protein
MLTVFRKNFAAFSDHLQDSRARTAQDTKSVAARRAGVSVRKIASTSVWLIPDRLLVWSCTSSKAGRENRHSRRMNMPEALPPFGHHGHFMIGTRLPGAPYLDAFLTAPPDSDRVTGHGVLTQATNPPLHANNAFHGVVTVLVSGPLTKQIYSLHGTALPPLPGATHVTHLLITLDAIWGTTGKATYTYVVGASFHEVRDVPVKVQWMPQE